MSAGSHANQMIGAGTQVVNITNQNFYNDAAAILKVEDSLKLLIENSYANALEQIQKEAEKLRTQILEDVERNKIDAQAFERPSFILDLTEISQSYISCQSDSARNLTREIIRSRSLSKTDKIALFLKRAADSVRGLTHDELETLSFVFCVFYLNYSVGHKEELVRILDMINKSFDGSKITSYATDELFKQGILNFKQLSDGDFRSLFITKVPFLDLPELSRKELEEFLSINNYCSEKKERPQIAFSAEPDNPEVGCRFFGLNETAVRDYYGSISVASEFIERLVAFLAERHSTNSGRQITIYSDKSFTDFEELVNRSKVGSIAFISKEGECIAYHYLLNKGLQLPPLESYFSRSM